MKPAAIAAAAVVMLAGGCGGDGPESEAVAPTATSSTSSTTSTAQVENLVPIQAFDEVVQVGNIGSAVWDERSGCPVVSVSGPSGTDTKALLVFPPGAVLDLAGGGVDHPWFDEVVPIDGTAFEFAGLARSPEGEERSGIVGECLAQLEDVQSMIRIGP